MSDSALRQQLHQQLDVLPEDLIREIADFTMFLMARRRLSPEHLEWKDEGSKQFYYQQLFREENSIEYASETAAAETPQPIPRVDWAAAFEQMASNDDDVLLDDTPILSNWDEDEWEW